MDLKGGELEVFNAVKRWSTRECKRQRLELTSENRRRVLEGAQYLVRYLIIPKEDFKTGPFKSGLLTSEEAEAVLTNLGAINEVSAVDLPDHLLYWQSIWKKPRRGRDKLNTSKRSFTNWNPSKRGSLSSLRRGSVTPSIRQDAGSIAGGPSLLPTNLSLAGEGPALSAPLGTQNGDYKSNVDRNGVTSGHSSRGYGKEKFNFIEEFFICLACIFDWWISKLLDSATSQSQSKKAKKRTYYSQFSTHIMHTKVNSTCSFLWKTTVQKNFNHPLFFLLRHSRCCNIWLNIWIHICLFFQPIFIR